MDSFRSRALGIVVAASLAGCSFATDSLFPSLTGGDSSATSSQLASTTPGQPTGTFVGQKVQQLRSDYQRLQASVQERQNNVVAQRQATAGEAQRYHQAVATINARLQVGTTPGNPQLVSQWNQAQGQLESVNNNIARMNNLATNVAGDSALAGYMLESVRAAYSLSGGVEEDHRQLGVLENDVKRTIVQVDAMLNELTDDINRQTRFVASERSNLTTLSLAVQNGQPYGPSLAGKTFAPTQLGAASYATTGVAAGRRPLVVIRYDRQNVQYQQALYTAVNQALQRRPDAVFDLVAVAAAGNQAQTAQNVNAAKRHAENVMRALANMGLPANRVNLSATTASGIGANEVQLYVR
jgi:hypothetical protein